MDTDILSGDVDAWFDAFERGDFAVAWENQQKALHVQFAASCKQNDAPYCDASLD